MQIKWAYIGVLRLAFFLIIGIFFGVEMSETAFFSVFKENCWQILVGFIFLYFLIVFFLPNIKKAKIPALLGILGSFNLVSGGMCLTVSHNHQNKQFHYTNIQDTIFRLKGHIVSEIQPTNKGAKAILEVSSIFTKNGWTTSEGKIMAFWAEKSAKDSALIYGDELLILGTPTFISEALNPDQFDYKRYLELQQQVFRQISIRPNTYKFVGKSDMSFLDNVQYYAILARKYCDNVMKTYIVTPQESGLASALVFGIKENLDEQVKTAYSKAGVTHVLAVSGMHVAIIFMILQWIRKLIPIFRNKWVFLFFAILLLWFYAYLTGFSASVLRAVAMFSFLIVGQTLKKSNNMYNMLGLSAFLLLLFNPFLVYDVGFQLSYMAVLGILYFYPKIYLLFDAKTWFTEHIWQMFCVSLAAQIATFPIIALFFHQYPTYSMLINMPVIPLGSLILILGVVLACFAWIPFVGVCVGIVVGFLLKWSIWLMNQIVFLSENLWYSTFKTIFSFKETIFVTLFLVLFCAWIDTRKLRFLAYACVCMGFLCFSKMYNSYSSKRQDFFAFYGINKNSANALIQGNQAYFLTDTISPKELNFALNTHFDNLYISKINYIKSPFKKDTIKNSLVSVKSAEQLIPELSQNIIPIKYFEDFDVMIYNEKVVVFLKKFPSKLTFNALNMLKINYLVIQNEAIKNISKIHEKIPFEMLIFDTSNRSFVAQKLKKQAVDLGIKCHNIFEDKYLIIK